MRSGYFPLAEGGGEDVLSHTARAVRETLDRLQRALLLLVAAAPHSGEDVQWQRGLDIFRLHSALRLSHG